jgi:hypothetical protein
MRAAIRPLDPASYVNHAVHRDDRAWTETNCYVDLWVELLHGFGYDPVASMAFTLGVDFEGDQWTFFKFPLADLQTLYGIEVMELNIWRSLMHHIREQVALGRPVVVEMDAWFLPDTAGTSYQREHVKTSIAVNEIDIEGKRLGYFHGPSYYTLERDDFDGVFRLGTEFSGPAYLPPYVEVAKLDASPRLSGRDLVSAAVGLTRQHLGRRPRVNPFTRYRERFARDLEWLKAEDLALFHAYAFATIRQFGACFELAATYLRWLEAQGEGGVAEAAADFDAISSTAKTLQFKTARAVNLKKPVDFAPLIDALEQRWESGMRRLDDRFRG